MIRSKINIFRAIISLMCILSSVISAGSVHATKNDLSWYNSNGQHSNKWNDLVRSGIESFDIGSRATGYILLKKAYENGCRDPLVLMKLGLYEEKREKYREAMTYLVVAANTFSKYYKSHSEKTMIDVHAARSAFMADNFIVAKQYANKAIALGTEDVPTYLIASQIYARDNEWKSSVGLLERAKTIIARRGPAEQMAPVLRLLVAGYFKLDEFEKAEITINDLLYLVPNDPIAIKYRAELQRQKNRKRQQELIKRVTE